jgi:hypothetical protein
MRRKRTRTDLYQITNSTKLDNFSHSGSSLLVDHTFLFVRVRSAADQVHETMNHLLQTSLNNLCIGRFK